MLRAVSLFVGLAVASVVVGFAFAWLAMLLMSAVLPPFDELRDEDTARNFFPPAIAYAVWATTAVGAFVMGWRWLGRER